MMKKSLVILIALCALLSFTSCAGGNGGFSSGGGGGKGPEIGDDYEFTAPDTNPKSDIDVSAWATYPFVKIAANGAVPDAPSTSYRVYMTRGETEGCQIAFRPQSDTSALTLKCVYKEESSIEYKIYVFDTNYNINGQLLPDPAKAYTEGAPFDVKSGKTLPFLVEFTSLRTEKAGFYPFVFELRDSSDKTVAQYTLIVRVWDISLPEKRTYSSSVVISEKNISLYYFGEEKEMSDEVYVRYYNMLLEHNMSAQWLPYDILDPRADEYMSDPRVTSFRVPHDVSDEKLLEYYKKLKVNTKWLHKAYFMPLGEPDTVEEIEQFAEMSMHLQQLCPGIKVTAPIYKDIQIDPIGWDQINAMKGYCTLWCPKLCLWDDEMSYGDHDYEHSMTFEERMRKMMSEGYGVWTYISHTPSAPYTAMFVNHSGLSQRVLFWQQFQRGICGFIYWSSNAWTTPFITVNPWENVHTGLYDDDGKPVFGDGILFYPGENIDDVPTVSHRMKIMRDGIDDMELLMLAAKTLGNRWINERVNSISSSLTSIDADEEAFNKIRIEIGNALEKALP